MYMRCQVIGFKVNQLTAATIVELQQDRLAPRAQSLAAPRDVTRPRSLIRLYVPEPKIAVSGFDRCHERDVKWTVSMQAT